MRIGIDIRKYTDFGIGTYIRNLLAEFDGDRTNQWIYFVSPELSASLSMHYSGQMIVNRSAKYSPGELLSMSRLANAAGCDVFHSPHYTFPFGLAGKGIVTIHDLIHLRVPNVVSAPKRTYARFLIGHACRAADQVIVDSEFTKQDVLKDFRIAAEKINVVHLGVSPAFRPAGGQDQGKGTIERLGIRRPYLLYSGALKPHKNVGLLLQAFARLTRTHDIDLVLSGEPLGGRPDLIALAKSLGITDRLVSTGMTSEADVVALNQHAMVSVLPSLYEGFGLSVLEAMASGVPVVAANATSIPEVVGDAGVLFEPRDVDDLVTALDRVLTDTRLRDELRTRGLARAGEFTWKRCAQKTLDIYRAAMAS
jgi:glycosyltransferase involved in cell wall biosynthesis